MQGSVSLTRHRIDLLSSLVCALIQVRLVNLRKLACSLPGLAQIASHYRRLQRFFSSGFSPWVFTELIVSKVVAPGQPQVLVMDRTHWKWGRTDLNVLCVGLVYQGVSIPLAYQSLQKPGNSNTDERKHLLTHVWTYLDARVCCLVADREFIGRDWVAFCWSNPSILSFAYAAIPRLPSMMVGRGMGLPLMHGCPVGATRY